MLEFLKVLQKSLKAYNWFYGHTKFPHKEKRCSLDKCESGVLENQELVEILCQEKTTTAKM